MQKRSIKIDGHATSVTMEEPFWLALKQIAVGRDFTLNALIAEIDATRQSTNLSSAVRLYILQHLQMQLDSKAG